MKNMSGDDFVGEEKLIYLAKLRAEAKKCRYLYERILPRRENCSMDYINMVKAEEALEKCMASTFNSSSDTK